MKATTWTIALAAAISAAAAFAGAAGDSLTLKCVRESHRYWIDEASEVFVDAPTPGTEVVLKFCRVGQNPLSTVVTTTPARVSFALGKPGFVRCWAWLKNAKRPCASVGIAFEPERLRTSLPQPADYDQFWENAFKELESIPADYKKRQIGKGVYAVSCNTANGKRQYGFLRLPDGPGPYPLRISVGGGEAYQCAKTALSAGAPKSSASLAIHLPPYEPVEDNAKEYHQEWLKKMNLKRFLFENIDKEPRDLYFYPCILGGCRLIDFAVKEPSIDRAKVTYSGASHGGGFGVYLTAFSPHIKAAFCGVPNFGNLSGPVEGRPIGISDGPMQGIWQKLIYYDAAYAAKRITVPVFMSVGFVDNAVMPDSIYPIYNELRGPKFMFDKVNHGHGDSPPEYLPMCSTWLENVLN